MDINPDSKVHGANMGPTWVLSAPGGPHVGLMNLAIWERPMALVCHSLLFSAVVNAHLTIRSLAYHICLYYRSQGNWGRPHISKQEAQNYKFKVRPTRRDWCLSQPVFVCPSVRLSISPLYMPQYSCTWFMFGHSRWHHPNWQWPGCDNLWLSEVFCAIFWLKTGRMYSVLWNVLDHLCAELLLRNIKLYLHIL